MMTNFGGHHLREARTEAGLTGRSVARQLAVYPETLSRWEAQPAVPRRVAYAVFHAIEILGKVGGDSGSK